MREKVVPIPFLGREVSSWLYRTTRWVNEHPVKSVGIVALCVAGSILYEAQVTHRNRIPSPNVNNHLEYQLRPEQPRWRTFLGLSPATAGAEAEPQGTAAETAEDAATPEEQAKLQAKVIAAQRNMEQAKRLLLEETDPVKRAELQAIVDKEAAIMKAGNDTTMIVRSGQLLMRNPHWDLRNSERNWSIMARDQQQQKDHYWYRLDRSRDDDYARNSYSRP